MKIVRLTQDLPESSVITKNSIMQLCYHHQTVLYETETESVSFTLWKRVYYLVMKKTNSRT